MIKKQGSDCLALTGTPQRCFVVEDENCKFSKPSLQPEPTAQQREFDTALDAMRAFQPQLKQLLSRANLERLRKENYAHLPEYPRALYTEVCNLYFHSLFFEDQDIRAFFKGLGFLDSDLKWFVPLEELLKVLDNIAGQSPYCQKHLALAWICGYLRMKSSYQVQRWAGYLIRYNGQKYPVFYKEWRNFLQRRREKKKSPFSKMSPRDAYIDETLFQPVYAVYKSEKRTEKYFLGVASGKIDNAWFKRINEACFPGRRTNDSSRLLFPLYQLIAKHHTLRTDKNRLAMKDQFEDTNDAPYKAKRPLELARCSSSVFESQ